MIQEMIRVRLPASRMKEAMAMLRPLVESTKTVPGCVACALHRDVLEDTVLLFYDLWSDEGDFQRHLRSEEYRNLLLVMEMAKEVPEVRFDVISHTSGLEAIERARIDVADPY
jgi:quinol monooxygenase YgiN